MKPNTFSADFKIQVVLEAVSEHVTMTDLAQKYELHPNRIGAWKQEFLVHTAEVFKPAGKQDQQKGNEAQIEQLYRKIGQLQIETDFLKKMLS